MLVAFPWGAQLGERSSAVRAKMECGRPIVYSFAGESALDRHALRSRLEAMDSAALLRFGQAAAYMCSQQANMGKEPREAFLVQLREAREEWRRRLAASRQAVQ